MSEKILCSAIWYNDGEKHAHQPKNIETGIVVCGMRHHNCIALLREIVRKVDKNAETFLPYFKENIQGFLTTENRFVDRWQAMGIAYHELQLNIPESEVHGRVFRREWNLDEITDFLRNKCERFVSEEPNKIRKPEDCPFRRLHSEDLW